MEPFERRGYAFCRYCGSFEFFPGPAEDGIQVQERPAADRPCPLCRGPLAVARLDRVHVVEHCEACRGILMPRATFAEAVAARRAREHGPPAAPVPLDRRELERTVTCPGCGTPMLVHPYYGPGSVVIDNCVRCDLVWLDHGELQQITDAPGSDRGRRTPPPEPPLDEPAASTATPPQPPPGRRRVSLADVFDAFFG